MVNSRAHALISAAAISVSPTRGGINLRRSTRARSYRGHRWGQRYRTYLEIDGQERVLGLYEPPRKRPRRGIRNSTAWAYKTLHGSVRRACTRPPRSPNGAACPSPKPRRASRRPAALAARPAPGGQRGAGGPTPGVGPSGRRVAGGGHQRAGGTTRKVAVFFLYSVHTACEPPQALAGASMHGNITRTTSPDPRSRSPRVTWAWWRSATALTMASPKPLPGTDTLAPR